jgi:hypothetical protein
MACAAGSPPALLPLAQSKNQEYRRSRIGGSTSRPGTTASCTNSNDNRLSTSWRKMAPYSAPAAVESSSYVAAIVASSIVGFIVRVGPFNTKMSALSSRPKCLLNIRHASPRRAYTLVNAINIARH